MAQILILKGINPLEGIVAYVVGEGGRLLLN